MVSSVIADCPDLVPPQYYAQVYASDNTCTQGFFVENISRYAKFPMTFF